MVDKLREEAILSVKRGENLFLTGKAGTGKLGTTKHIIYKLSRHLKKIIHLTAPTGIAIINVNGTTINQFLGWLWSWRVLVVCMLILIE
jgi:ATP-dependent DNA helicase PIF1